ncbi:hypothetical protein M407DRAFT_211821 [Tulasnella calospora MUT 4182]|uniref:Uncharacterized protein n=1 Tax=Tulasnella calospora MUT 4182 TaxID=1051891 RepID=A0A0C3LU47_9AGAM|nr:hypothetical protein M407DRAFT_211821 [Tulasnella calospora MUT 4182]
MLSYLYCSSSGRAFTPPPSPPTTSDAIRSPGHGPLFPISGDEGTRSPVAASSKRTERRGESSLTASRDSRTDSVKFECTTEELTRPQRKKARFASVAESSGSTTPTANAALQLLPPPYPRFDDMPLETLAHILRLCFEELESPEAYVAMLHKLYWLGRHPRDVINKLPELWTNVHPSSPTGFIEYSLQQAFYHPISVYYKPKPKSFTNSAHSEERWQDFHKFLRLVKPQSNQWERMDMVVTPDSLASLTTALESPVPNLRSLSVVVTAAPWSNPLALPMAPSLRAQVDRRLNLLAGERQSLQHLKLKNVPARFDPSAFAGLVCLSLADGTRLRYTEVITFLGSSVNLRTLSLANIRWLDNLRAPAVNDQDVSPSQLKDLTLVELLEHTGLTNLLYHIDIRTCHRLHLHTLATVELLGQRLAEKVVPIVEKILPTQPHTSLDIRHYLTLVEMSWKGRGTPQGSDGEQEMRFHIGFSSNNPNRSDQLFNFVRRVLDLTGSSASISLDIHDSLSGIAPIGHGLGSIMAIPTLSTEILRRLDITEVSASFAEGYLGYMKDFLIEDRRPRFPHLRSVQLRYIPSSQVVVQLFLGTASARVVAQQLRPSVPPSHRRGGPFRGSEINYYPIPPLSAAYCGGV